MTHFEAYRERLQRNTDYFTGLMKQLTEKGYDCYYLPKGNITFVKIEKEGKGVSVDFREVPYRWGIYKDLNPQLREGSSRTIKEVYTAPTAEDLISVMEPLEHSNVKWLTRY